MLVDLLHRQGTIARQMAVKNLPAGEPMSGLDRTGAVCGWWGHCWLEERLSA